jgi:hypothetical protein
VPTILDLTGLDHILAGLRRIQHLDATSLMLSWQLIIETDNRDGIMKGLDKDGVPINSYAPITYRPKGPPKRHLRRKVGAFNPGVGGNLSSSEYRRLGGPPLAPRGTGSRVITNLLTGKEGQPGDTQWAAIGYWEGVVSPKGNPFLIHHFTGAGRLPRRDLRGLRPAGRAKALTALQAWGRGEIRDAFG